MRLVTNLDARTSEKTFWRKTLTQVEMETTLVQSAGKLS